MGKRAEAPPDGAVTGRAEVDGVRYPEGLGPSAHIAHDIRKGRFPGRSSIAEFLAERAAELPGKARPSLSMLDLLQERDALRVEVDRLAAELAEARAGALREAAEAVRAFDWVLPFYGDTAIDEATDDCAEEALRQAADAIAAPRPAQSEEAGNA